MYHPSLKGGRVFALVGSDPTVVTNVEPMLVADKSPWTLDRSRSDGLLQPSLRADARRLKKLFRIDQEAIGYRP